MVRKECEEKIPYLDVEKKIDNAVKVLKVLVKQVKSVDFIVIKNEVMQVEVCIDGDLSSQSLRHWITFQDVVNGLLGYNQNFHIVPGQDC